MPFYILNFYKPIHFTILNIDLHCLLKHKLPEDRQPLSIVLQAPFIIERHQLLAPLPGSFGLFKRQFRETRSPVDHSIGNFIPFSLNSVFSFIYLFCCFDLFLFYCAWAFGLETIKVEWELLRYSLEVFLIHPQTHPHLPSWLKKEKE